MWLPRDCTSAVPSGSRRKLSQRRKPGSLLRMDYPRSGRPSQRGNYPEQVCLPEEVLEATRRSRRSAQAGLEAPAAGGRAHARSVQQSMRRDSGCAVASRACAQRAQTLAPAGRPGLAENAGFVTPALHGNRGQCAGRAIVAPGNRCSYLTAVTAARCRGHNPVHP
jgi:hypothetical protein